ncbi:putative ribonuclease H protein [Tanacetum coccineum]
MDKVMGQCGIKINGRMYQVFVEESCCMDEEWDPQKAHEQGTSNEEEELGSENESEEDSDWEEGDGYEDEQWEDSDDWVDEDVFYTGENEDDQEVGEDVAGDGNFRQRVVESEGSHNGPMDGGVPKVMGDGEGGAKYREESREDATVVGFIEGSLKGVNGPEQSGCDSRSSKQRDENGSAHKNVVNEPIVNNTSNCVKTKNVNALIGECVDINNCVDQFQPLNDNNIKEVSEKNNNTINCECVATESKAKSDNQNERSRSNRNKDAIKSHTRSKERSFDCGNKLKGKLSMCKMRELARSKLLMSQMSAMGIQNRKKDMKTYQGRSSKTSRGSKAKSKSSNVKSEQRNLGRSGEDGGSRKCLRVTNENERAALWDRISRVLAPSDTCWCIFGDFNEVRRLDERLNSEFSKKEALAFNDFIRSEQLIDVPLGGKRFTRISDDGRKFSKLDRYLITEDFQEIWRNLGSVALDRKLSDHCLIVLLDKGLDFGPKPFRFFDAWLKDVEMIDVVKEAWGAPVSTITPDCVFRDKLKNVKHALKEWSKKKYGGLEQEIDSSRKEAGRWEREAELRPLEIDEIEAWQRARLDWIEKDGLKAKMLRQKARVRWYEEGDENSKFFHSTVRKRYRKNGFTGLMVDGRWNENPDDIKQTVFNYYQGVFKETNSNRPRFASGRFRRLSQGDASLLEAPFEDEEI